MYPKLPMPRLVICGQRPLSNGLGKPNRSGQLPPSCSPPNQTLRFPATMNSLKKLGEKVCSHVGASDMVWLESNSRPATPLSIGCPTPPAVVGYSVEDIDHCTDACTWSRSEKR